MPTSSAYGASKAALINLGACLKIELDRCGVGVSISTPGFVETPAQTDNAPSGTTEKAAPEVTPEDDNERADALTPMAANDPEKSDAAHSGSTEQSQPTTKTRINKVRACLELFLRDGVSPHIESIWLHIQRHAGKDGFPFKARAADYAVHVDGEKINKTTMTRSLQSLLKTQAKQ